MPVTFDKASDTYTCSVHGALGEYEVGWLRCWAGCEDGYFDGYEEDPLWYDEGDLETCETCVGKGGWNVCRKCAGGNPDVE